MTSRVDPLTKQYNNEKFSNIAIKVIRTAKNKDAFEDVINCNSLILASYSVTFEKMFEDISKENGKLEIDMTNIRVDALDRWLRYMYRDTTAIDIKTTDQTDEDTKSLIISLLDVYGYLNLTFEDELKILLTKLINYELGIADIVFVIKNSYSDDKKMFDKVIRHMKLFVQSLAIKKTELTNEEQILLETINERIIQEILKNTNSSMEKYVFIYNWWTVTRNEEMFIKYLEKTNICFARSIQDQEFIKDTLGTINPYYSNFANMIWRSSGLIS